MLNVTGVCGQFVINSSHLERLDSMLEDTGGGGGGYGGNNWKRRYGRGSALYLPTLLPLEASRLRFLSLSTHSLCSQVNCVHKCTTFTLERAPHLRVWCAAAGDGDDSCGEGNKDDQRHIIFKLDCSFLHLQYCLFSITMAFAGLVAAIQYSCTLQKRKLAQAEGHPIVQTTQ